MQIQIYGIPTCGTCKKALRWMDSQDLAYDWINTREQPPTHEMVASWIKSLGNKPLRNTSGGSYRALGEEKLTWEDAQWCDAFAADPMLLKRPLLVINGTATAVGFREDQWREALQLP